MALLALVTVGCAKVNGGWITSASGSGKGAFAFHGDCDQATQTAKGKLQ